MTPLPKIIPEGFCRCGCGQKTRLAPKNKTRGGWIKGCPIPYIHGHSAIKVDPSKRRTTKVIREDRKAAGLCFMCGKRPSSPKRLVCDQCRESNSRKANEKFRQERRKGCKVCGGKVTAKRARLCDEHRSHRQRECSVCGERFKSRMFSKFCSIRCTGLARRIPAEKKKRGRSFVEHREWRRAALKRDNKTCQKCGKFGRGLHAHHIKEFARYPELRTVVSNGVTLCAACHRQVHWERSKRYAKSKHSHKVIE